MNRVLWALFGNDDDGPTGPPSFMPAAPPWWRRVCWWIRNPAHNFTFYVIGIAGRDFFSTGDYPFDVFNPRGGWNRCERVYFGKRYPFISYIGWCKFYFGWRERGNFGMKLTNNNKGETWPM